MNGQRKLKITKLEDARHVGIPEVHMGMKKMNIFKTIILQVYIQPDQFITLSLKRNELCILLNCHHICVLAKL